MHSFTPAERETTVVSTDDQEVVVIWTAQRKHLTRLRKHPAFTETGSGFHGTSEWAEFTIPADSWSPATGAKRQVRITEAERERRAARLAAQRKAS